MFYERGTGYSALTGRKVRPVMRVNGHYGKSRISELRIGSGTLLGVI
jgi:hypothetical protein